MSQHETPNAPEDDESYLSGLLEESEKPKPWYRTGPGIVGTIAAIIAIAAVLMTIVLATDKRVVKDNTPLTSTPSTTTEPTAPSSEPSSTTTTTTTTEPPPQPAAPVETAEPTYEAPASTTYQYEAPAIPPIPQIPQIPPIPPIPPIPQIPGL